jgi:hypothetical protein
MSRHPPHFELSPFRYLNAVVSGTSRNGSSRSLFQRDRGQEGYVHRPGNVFLMDPASHTAEGERSREG